jgi:hypothetical protein
VHVFPPTAGRPFAVLVTSGMSARPMNVPFGVARRRERENAELCMLLPAAWPLAVAAAHGAPEESAYWPIRLLRELARLPHEQGTWLGVGHAVPHGAPYAQGLPFTAAVLVSARPRPCPAIRRCRCCRWCRSPNPSWLSRALRDSRV